MSEYPVTEGVKWTPEQRVEWFNKQVIERSYKEEVLERLLPLHKHFDALQYAALSIDPARYPTYALKSKDWDESKPNVLITGGVHGYETSGVQGAIGFAREFAETYKPHFNLLILPCVSPWGYETINRWNPKADDPNRSFCNGGETEESANIIRFLKENDFSFLAHFDLHETTDTDNSRFRPEKAARDGIPNDNWNIPDGFYTVADTANPEPDFQKAVIEAVKTITHIAPPDENGELIGAKMQQEGVIYYDMKSLGLCGGMTNAKYTTTTEVYPDSPKATPEICNAAQMAAVCGGLNYLINKLSD